MGPPYVDLLSGYREPSVVNRDFVDGIDALDFAIDWERIHEGVNRDFVDGIDALDFAIDWERIHEGVNRDFVDGIDAL